jgi:arylsulfatase A-like enzyme
LYGDVIECIDWSTGRVLDALRRNGLERNTIVIFTSDNGPKQGHGSAAPLRGFKHQPYEGGVRVPCVAYAPGRIPAGRTIDEVTAVMDLYPTLAALAGAENAASHAADGRNIWRLLSGQGKAARGRDEFFYFVRHGVLAGVRQRRWKLLVQDGRAELYDLQADLAESKNLAQQRPEIVRRLAARMRQFEADLQAASRPPGKTSTK